MGTSSKDAFGAALCGELVVTQNIIDQLIAREIALTTAFCETAKIVYPGSNQIEKTMRHKESVAGTISINDRFIIGGLKRRQLLDVSRNFGIKLYNNDPKSADNDGEEIPTVQGIFQCDFIAMMVPTNENHHPFMLDYDQQWTWATEQGGHGFSTTEQALYFVIRARLELGRIPFMGGSFRCNNAYGFDYSLNVCFSAGLGLNICYLNRSVQSWNLGALPWKYWGF
jgi:hypothetical protein